MAAKTPYLRYAIYYAPEKESLLAKFGAAWFGWDPETAAVVDRPSIDGLPEPTEVLTARPARYGLHGTLKAPFRLAEGLTATALAAAIADFAEDAEPVLAPKLALSAGLGFVSLRPSGPSDALNALAADIVQSLDAFRAPLTDAELQTRRTSGLSPRQDANLLKWGYPHVLEDFHFHVTLTRQLEPEKAAQVCNALAPAIEPMLQDPFSIRELCLFGDPGPAKNGAPQHFKLLRRYRLTGSA